MRFVDRVKIFVQSGAGGDGCVSFRREKFVPRGGPDGGDGGRGGDVILRVDPSLSTLIDFRYKREYTARHGYHGQGARKTGRDAEPVALRVPPGTQVFDSDSGEMLADLKDGEFVVARGGRGGRGNAQFATSTRQTPRFAQPGEEGVSRNLILELKLIADAGIVGLPNAGKSTLISRISAARPKVAEYPFTTLVPNLGVVRMEDHRSFVVADVPGLIEGASRGVGLGHQFLRHVERTSVILHLVGLGPADGDPVDAYRTVRKEMEAYAAEISAKPFIVALNKADLLPEEEREAVLRDFTERAGVDALLVSAVAGMGIMPLLGELSRHVFAAREDSSP